MAEDTKDKVVTEEEVTQQNQDEDEKVLENSEENGIVKKAEKIISRPPERRRDRIPNIRMLPEVTIFCYKVDMFNFRYSVTPPLHTDVLWSKKMTGGEAHQFLINVKAKNRLGKLESRALPDSE